MSVDKELDNRYDGDATKLYNALQPTSTDGEAVALAVIHTLINGCFCPSCMLSALNHIEKELVKNE
tara:strand:+ start:1856 stop:2053 length:198 start_codon:yes stop_codon:yes gene_type:complete